MRRVRAAIRQRLPQVPVELAFLEFMAPTLPECAASLVLAGADRIVVVPMFIARGGHLKKDVPAMLAVLQASHPEVEFSLGGAIGENEAVVQAMAMAALDVAGLSIACDTPC